MEHVSFAQLCREAGQILDLFEPDALGLGEVVTIENIDLQFIPDSTGSNLARLYLEVGDIKPEEKVEVYESLFAIQLLMDGVMDGQFVFDNLHDRMMLMVRLPLSDDTEPFQLAGVIRSFVLQVQHWRSTILVGRLFDINAEDFDQPVMLSPEPMQVASRLA